MNPAAIQKSISPVDQVTKAGILLSLRLLGRTAKT